jgi:integral membrane protein (TIGR01906 family)
VRGGLTIAVALSVFCAALAMAIWLLASEPFLALEYGRAGFPSAPGIADEERLALAIPSTLFLTRPAITDEDLAALRHDGAPLYTRAEIEHLEDVRELVWRITLAGVCGALVIVAALLVAGTNPRAQRAVARGLSAGGFLIIGALVIVVPAVLVLWPVFFVTFHEVLFPPGTWAFSADSGLIRLFPEQFWYDTALAMVTITGAIGLAALGAGRALGGEEPV